MDQQATIRAAPLPKPGWKKLVWRKLRAPLGKSGFVAGAAVLGLDLYLRFVNRTNRLLHYDTEKADHLVATRAPMIVTCWHGQHFMMPFFPRKGHPSVALVSRSRDAELNARLVERMGFETVRASGGRDQKKMVEKGAIRGVVALRNHLRDGRSIFMIADIPHGTPREAGMGIVSIARLSGVPIVPVAYASSRRHVFRKAWDKAVLNLPFGRAAFCIGEPIDVPADADEEMMETLRMQLQKSLNSVQEEAYSMVGAAR